jgi:hypothetical protein
VYDIPNALRRRAMAERLERLERALETPTYADEMSDSAPRHLAEPPPEHPPGTATSDAFSSLGGDVAEPEDVRTAADVRLPPHPAAPPSPITGYPAVMPMPGDLMLAAECRTPEQPARLDVPTARRELTDPLPGWPDEPEIPDEPPRGGSSASTIADLLRHGSTALFFERST